MKHEGLRSIVAVLLCGLVLSVAAYAVPPAPGPPGTPSTPIGTAWIVAIGVGTYARQDYHALPYAPQGVKSIVSAFCKGLGSYDTKAFELTTSAPDPLRKPNPTNIVRILKEIAEQVKSTDLVIVYFCGHGIESDGNPILLLTDADLTDNESIYLSCLPLAELKKRLDNLPCSGRLLILDACRTTPRTTGGVSEYTPMTRDFIDAGSMAQPAPGRVSATFYGCQAGESTYYDTEGGKSYFTEAIIEGLSGKAALPNGSITLQSLKQYVENTVPGRVAKTWNAPRQHPTLILPSNSENDLLLRSPDPIYVAVTKFTGESGDVISGRMEVSLHNAGFNLVLREQIEPVLKEHKFESSGLTETAKAAKLGGFLNAQYVVIGTTLPSRPQGTYQTTAKLVEVRTAKIVNTALTDWDDNSFQQRIDNLCSDLSGVIRPQTPRIETPPLTGGVTIKSTPPGATVLLDDKEAGVTDAAGELPIDKLAVGDHEIRLRLANYREVTRTIQVKHNDNQEIPLTLIGLPGQLTVTSTPEGASVALDGEQKGNTSLTINDIPAGQHTIKLSLNGYQDEERTVDITPNGQETLPIVVMREMQYARVLVTSEPPGATVFVKGEERGTTPITLPFEEIGAKEQTVEIEVRLADYQSQVQSTSLKIGEQKDVRFQLKKGPPTNAKDGAELVLIPAGEFNMGNADRRFHITVAGILQASISTPEDERPLHKVFLNQYLIYKYEVTVGQYRKFCEATGRKMPPAPKMPPALKLAEWPDDAPMVNVSWDDATAYATWAGASLPTEAQWEKAARGMHDRVYPWGDFWNANYCNCREAGPKHPVAVTAYSDGQSSYGVFNMLGNVAEWCLDYYDKNYYAKSAQNNPVGPPTGEKRVVRGGSWYSTAAQLRNSARSSYFPSSRTNDTGFRCVIIPIAK